MAKAKVFTSGNSQAVRLPKQFRLSSSEVEIFRRGDEIVLREEPKNLAAVFQIIIDLPEDCLTTDREDSKPQERDGL